MDTPVQSSSGINMNHIRVCSHCGLRYDWRKSPSSMKMTYCSSLCEKGDLGFTLEALLRYKPVPREEPVEAAETR